MTLKNMQMHCPLSSSSPPDVGNEDREHDGSDNDDVSKLMVQNMQMLCPFMLLCIFHLYRVFQKKRPFRMLLEPDQAFPSYVHGKI